MYSKDELSRISPLLNPFIFDALLFTGKRSISGFDVRYTHGDFLLSGEYLMGNFNGNIYTLAA